MKIVRTAALASMAGLAFSAPAHAGNFNINPQDLLAAAQATAQANFEGLSDDLAAAIWMNPSNSAEPHSDGIIPVGFSVGAELSMLKVDNNASHWAALTAASPGLTVPAYVPAPKLRASAGIPFGIDAGIMIVQIPNSNVKVTGFEGRFSIGQFIPVPMLEANIRAYQSKLTGITDYTLTDQGVALMVGLDLPFVKPYAEVGQMKATSTPSGALTSGLVALSEYSKTVTTTTIGVKITAIPLLTLTGEVAKVGSKSLTTVKLAVEF
ncbi:MAG: hypothetical protein COX57_06260 [Alphaproteobacteria bacterium CG_4_10_14_0_2_um_filter_63_37]|nr:MAG: hypothetical protein AUJ55_01740 [Proteobacteria bacterium CG1_02_64_396]PJA24917.1 MAG: hypothetical protein COX57_06260 [Alphaproteobacteria bacterium CG_4_10_14_0_2_um_filter_63_37]